MAALKEKIALVLCPPFWLKTPPLSLEYLKNYIKDKASVDIFDLNILFFRLFNLSSKDWLKLDREFETTLFARSEERFKKDIDSLITRLSAYDYVGFSLFKRNLDFSLKLSKGIEQASKKTKMIFGGPQVRESKDLLSDRSITVEGEGEIPLLKVIDGTKDKYFSCQQLQNLDSLSFNDFSGFDLKDYKPVLPLLSSRGCVRRCAFCAERTLYKGFRQHSPGYIADQIEYLLKTAKTDQFSFQDSLINADAGWLKDLCQRIIKKRLRIKWEAQLMIKKSMDKDTLSLMKRSGCINLFVGLESGSDRILQKMDKGFTVTQAQGFFKDLKGSGLAFEVSLIVGYPGEKDEDFKKTLSFLKDNRQSISTIAQVSSFSLYKGSLLSQKNSHRPVDEKIIKARMGKILRFIEKEKIRHKKAFIDNLSYS